MKRPSGFSVKLFFIGIVVLLLIIGNVMIKSKLEDRESAYHDALRSISESAGGSFESAGPFIVIPYDETVLTKNSTDEYEQRTQRRYHFITAKSISYTANLVTEKTGAE